MARELVFPATLQIIGGGRILPSPNQFYVTGEDALRIVSANALTGVAIKLQCRTANVQGDTVPQSFDHVPATDRSVRTQDYAIGTGSLLNVTVFAAAATPQIGQTYVMVQLVRGLGSAAVVLGTLLAGYVTRTQALGFPGSPIVQSIEGGGAIRTIAGTVPQPGGPATETVPTGARWELYAVQTSLATAAGGATRTPFLQVSSASGALTYIPQGVGVAPSASHTFCWGVGLTSRDSVPINVSVAELVAGLKMLAAQGFSIVYINPQLGDQLERPVYTVREWLEV